MTKKSRRSRAKHQGASRTIKPGAQEHIVPAKSAGEPKASVSVGSVPSSSIQTNRYQYVVPELRRIGIIAGSLVVVLIILTFILG